MKRPALYSGRQRGVAPTSVEAPPAPTRRARLWAKTKVWSARPGALWAGLALVGGLLAFNLWQGGRLSAPLTQDAINQAVLHALNTQTLPSPAARAYETVLPSVVRVTGYVTHPKTGEDIEHGVGTGVVIVDTGVILTNLHVAAGAQKLHITFHDGQETTARVIGAQPESDLAVLQVQEVPDDLRPATMVSTDGLLPGDRVAAVGFPFGIGPSVSSGVVSGLQRSFESPDGKQSMDNLIQFDAAANPGNSGGPLVTMSGEVVGIVTAIYNPNRQRTFVGIGFAVPIESAASAVGLPPF